jgi:phage tail sheath protein FI
VESYEVAVFEAPSAGPISGVTDTVGGVTDTVGGATDSVRGVTDNLLGGGGEKQR